MQLPPVVYATFAGPIDQMALSRIFQSFAAASQAGAKEVHLLFQSNGGIINDGISLYNFFRSQPLKLHVYNTGAVQSIAVLGYLAAAHRYSSTHGTFLIHKAHGTAQVGANASRLGSMVTALVAEDARIEAIIKSHTTIPEDKWKLHATEEVIFNAQEAVSFGIAESIREFAVPAGDQLFNV